MSVPHPGGDPNANLYAQLKRDVLDRVSQVIAVEYVPDAIEARQLRALFDPDRLTPPTGNESPELTIRWYRQDPPRLGPRRLHRPEYGFHAGWHQDEDHPHLGRSHFQSTVDDETDRREFAFEHETPSLICWEIVSDLFERVLPRHQSDSR